MTRRHFLLVPALALLLLPGCGQKNTASGPTTPAASGEAAAAGDFKVALLTTGPVDDDGWNQLAYTALQQVQKDTGAQIDKEENLKNAQFADAFRDFASKGYKIIFAHGDEFADAAAKVAPQFPNTVFVTSGGDKTGPNLMPINFRTEEGTYLQGMEAALVSKTGKGGFVGGQNLPPVARAAQGLTNGARAINPQFDFRDAYINSWDDTTAAKAQTETLINNGADVIAHNCDAAAKGLFQAAQAKPGVYTFGVNSDQNHIAPNVISSVYLNFPKVFSDIAQQVKAGSFKAAPLDLGLKDGNIKLIDNPKLPNLIPAAGKAKIQQAQQDIIAGKIKVAG